MADHLQLVLTDDMPEDYRHPMWTTPSPDLEMPDHVRRVRKMIAVALTPYDGRPNSEYAVDYLSHAYTITQGEVNYPPLVGLMGAIAFITEQHVDRFGDTQFKKDILYQLARKLTRVAYDGRRASTTE